MTREAATDRRKWVGLAAVVLLGLVLRAMHLSDWSRSPFFLVQHNDPWTYHKWAEQILAGDWAGRSQPVFYLGPLYSYFLALVYRLARPTQMAAAVAQLVLSTATVALTYHLGRRAFGAWVGFTAGLFAAAYSMLVFHSALLLPATLIVFLNAFTLVWLAEGLHAPRWWKWLLAGVGLGLSAAARANVALFGPAAVAAIVLGQGMRGWRRWLPAAALFSASFFVTIAPIGLHNWLVGDDLVLLTANQGANFYIGNWQGADGIYMNAARYQGRPLGLSVKQQRANFPEVARRELGVGELKPSAVSRFWNREAWRQIAADPGRWLRLLVSKSRYYFNAYEIPNNYNSYFCRRFSAALRLPLLTFGTLLPLAILGAIVSRGAWRRHAALYGFWLTHYCALILYFLTDRYRLTVVPVLFVFAAVAVVEALRAVRARRWRPFAAAAVLLLVLYPLVHSRVPHFSMVADWVNLGNAHRNLRQLEQAVTCYDKALSLQPGYYDALQRKGEALAGMARYDEAEKTLRRALGIARRKQDAFAVRELESDLARLP